MVFVRRDGKLTGRNFRIIETVPRLGSQRVENRVYTRVPNFQVTHLCTRSLSVPVRASFRDPRTNRNSRNEWLIVANWFSSNLRVSRGSTFPPGGLLPRHRSRLLIQAYPKQTDSVPVASLRTTSVLPLHVHACTRLVAHDIRARTVA